MAIRRADGVTFEPSGDSVVILGVDGNVMTTLNEVGTLIWNELGTPREVPGLVERLSGRFPQVAEAELEADIESFIADLAAAELVVVD